MTYDEVLDSVLPRGCSTFCYSDDTAVVASGHDFAEVRARAELGAATIISAIEQLGLRVVRSKTEVAAFVGGCTEFLTDSISIGGKRISVSRNINYLGVTLDSSLSFRDHFQRVLPKAEGVAAALGRLMSNLMRAPDEQRRRLYASIVHSIVMYDASI